MTDAMTSGWLQQSVEITYDGLIVDDDVVDRYVDQFDEETDETHDREADGGGHCDLLELLLVRLRASFHQTNGVFSELFDWLGEQQNLLHFDIDLKVLID